jgi:hypothetical protein
MHRPSPADDSDRKGGRGNIEEPSDAMVNFLTRIGLTQIDPDYKGSDRSRAPHVITSKGYEFMLRDANAQVWLFVLQYLNAHADNENKDAVRAEALSFLVCLGSCRAWVRATSSRSSAGATSPPALRS